MSLYAISLGPRDIPRFENELLSVGVDCDLFHEIIQAIKRFGRPIHSHEDSKGSSQPSFQKDFMEVGLEVVSQCQPGEQNQNLFVTSQPKFHQEGRGIDPALPKIKSVSREDDEAQEKGLQKMTRHKENLLILEKFLRVSQEKKGGIEGVFLTTSFLSKTDVSAVEERVKKMATALARVSLREWMLTGFLDLDSLEDIFTRSDLLEAFQKNSFKSFAKLILRICDMEDFERFNCSDEIAEESRQFNDKILLPLKSDENPYQLVAERKMDFDEFPLLREQDVSELFEWCTYTKVHTADVFAGVRVLENFGLAVDGKICFEEGCHGRFVELARTVLLEHVPVVESIRIHSILDFLVCQCGLAVDEFVQEAVSDAVWNPELEKLLTNDQLNCLAEPIAFRIIWVVLEKCEVVYDLVKIADGLRRNQDHRFINTHHILWAIRLTGLKDLVDKLVKSVGLRNVVEEPAKCPSYFVYKTAQATAEYHGNEVVEVEHLAVATVFEMEWNQRNLCEFKEEEHTENLREFNKRECVTQFITDVRSYKRECGDNFFWVSLNLDPEAKITSGGGSIHSAVKKYGVPKPLYIRPDFDD